MTNKTCYYRIYEREQEEPCHEFIGHLIVSEGRDALYQEGRRWLHYVYESTVQEGEFFIRIDHESWYCGVNFPDLLRSAQDWIEQVWEGNAPALLDPWSAQMNIDEEQF
jgi:hypothetical protein